MNAQWLDSLAHNPVMLVIGWTLIHFVWQAALIAVGAAIVLCGLRSALARYRSACVAMAAMLVAPLVTASILGTSAELGPCRIESQSANLVDGVGAKWIEAGAVEQQSALRANSSAQMGAGLGTSPQTSVPAAEWVGPSGHATVQRLLSGVTNGLPIVVAMWSLGVLALTVRLMIGFRRIWKWRREGAPIADPRILARLEDLCRRLDVRRTVRLLQSRRIAAPAVIGWMRPMILVPTSMLTGLTPSEMELILAHELAHVRRMDFLFNLLQTVVEILLFYHPAVWWLSRQIRIERENCCDDIAASSCGSRIQFARALARMEELRCGRPRLAMSAAGGSLVQRVRRLVEQPVDRTLGWWPAGAALAAVLILLGVLGVSAIVPQIRPQEPVRNDRSNETPLVMQSSGEELGPARQDAPDVRVIATHSYDQSRRESTGWIEVKGSRVPVDVGVEYDGVIVYETLFFDIVALDAKTHKVLWQVPGAKNHPFWKAVSIVEFQQNGKPQIAVELYAVDDQSRQPIYRYVTLRTGETLESPRRAQPNSNADVLNSDEELLPVAIEVEKNGDVVTRAMIRSSAVGRSPAEMLKHLAMAIRNDPGLVGSVTNHETIVSARDPHYLLQDRMDASEVLFNLPEGSGLRAEFSGERVDVQKNIDFIRILVTQGQLQLIDAGGVIRATASADGGAEQLVVTCQSQNGETIMTLHTQRIVESPEYPQPPVQVVMNTQTGAPADEGDPPHGAARYSIDSKDGNEAKTVRMRMSWRYELRRLAEEAEAQTGKPWEELMDEGTSSRDDGPGQRPAQKMAVPDSVLDQARRLGNWLGDPTQRFDSRGYMQLADRLLQLAPERRTDLLREMGKQKLDAQLVVLCRLLFEAKEVNGEFRPPSLGEPNLVGYDQRREDFPLLPVALIRGVPVLVVQGYRLAGERESAAEYLEYCLEHCRWTSRSYAQADEKIAPAIPRIVDAPFWGERIDVDEWVEVVWIRNQLVPSLLLSVAPMEHVAAEIPVFAWNRRVGVKPDTVVKDLEERGMTHDSEIIVMIDNGTKREWLQSILRPLADAGYGSFVFVRWQESPHPVSLPELSAWLAIGSLGPPAAEGSLRLALSSVDRECRVGQPFRLRLQMTNVGDTAQSFDPQYYEPFRALKVTRQNGESDLFIGSTPQTSGGETKLAAGDSMVLWESCDASELYMLDAGEYEISVAAPRRAPPKYPHSNTLKVTVLPGQQPPLKRLIGSLQVGLPEGWTLSTNWGAVYLTHSPTGLKRDVAFIQIWFTDEALAEDFKLGEGESRQVISRLGHGKLGYLNVGALPEAIRRWPDYLEHICVAAGDLIGDPLRTEDATEPASLPVDVRPWAATGRVTDDAGNPIAGATIRARCGAGTLRETGSTLSDADGRYQLKFGSGIQLDDPRSVQAATISVQLDGYFEKNLCRQGDRVAALERPEGETGWGGKTEKDLFLPGEPKGIDFVMLPATRLRGMVIDADGIRRAGIRVSLTGDHLPPSSSVIDQVRTDENGEFEFANIPTGYAFQVLVEPAKAEPPWIAWASPAITFVDGDGSDPHIKYSIEGRPVDFSFQRLYLILKGRGENWKEALADAAQQPLELTWDGLSTDKRVSAGMAFLELGGARQ